MGLIKFFSEILHDITDSLKPKNDPTAAPIPESEKKYYRPDSYYTSRSYEGTGFGKPVITFEERKKTCIPSRTGLYVAEILLLEYCTYGTYPAPKNGYPGFWWFEYGIRNVGAALKSLEERGYIKYGCLAYSLKELTVPDLKELLKQHGMATTGKKAELIERAAANINEADLLSFGMVPKYELTALGESELKENAYVSYLHGNRYDMTVWEMNQRIAQTHRPYRDILWGYFNEQSLIYFQNLEFGRYRNIRLDMYRFLMEENRTQEAFHMLCEVLSLDLNDCYDYIYSLEQQKNDVNFEFYVMDYELRLNDLFPYEKTVLVIPPKVFTGFAEMQITLSLDDKEYRDAILKELQKTAFPRGIFTNEECADILIANIHSDTDTLTTIYRKAERREKAKLKELKSRVKTK